MSRRSAAVLLAGSLAALTAAGPARAATLPNDKLAEPAIMGGPSDLEYLRKLHAHVHKRWADNFLALIGQNLALNNPLNDPARFAEADVVVSAQGKLVSATITKSSGDAGFDGAISEVLKDSVPFPVPPVASRSDDDNLHLRWTFARDERRCSGVAVVHVDDPLEIAIPKLMTAGRRDEIVARLAAARGAGLPAEPAMTSLANEWLRGAGKQQWATVKIAGALAGKGDADALAFLKAAVTRPADARAAGALLSANKVAVCPLVKAALEGGAPADQLTAAQALATSGETACAAGLVKMLQNGRLKAEARAAAATALGPIDDAGAQAALATAAKDEPNLTVKAAASLAQIRPNAGRAKMFAMVHLLKEPSVEMRAAGSAGLVRAGGDSDLDDLYMLFRDTDPRPAEATLRELDRVKGQKATEMIAKLMKRPLVPVQRAAAQLLVKRRAKATFPAFANFADSPDAELKGMSLVAADDAKLAGAGADPKLGMWAYRARLARGERDRAADWLLAAIPTMQPAQQADAMVEWLATADAPTTTASKTRR
ncbi:MAG TPA: TonB C-terminal domain-containing protein [Polyangia bacterium]|nr:TonB C-terminal domain-containing protein [Polyangia bacterium]